VRGLKWKQQQRLSELQHVAPFMGAWIEIIAKKALIDKERVAPFMGAWIEIENNNTKEFLEDVAPFMGAWIEISFCLHVLQVHYGRTFYGCVD